MDPMVTVTRPDSVTAIVLTDDTLGRVVANDDTVPFIDAVEKIVLTSDTVVSSLTIAEKVT